MNQSVKQLSNGMKHFSMMNRVLGVGTAVLGLVSPSAAQSIDSAMDWTIQVVKFYRPPIQVGRRLPTHLPPDPPLRVRIDPRPDSTLPPNPPARAGDSLPPIPAPRIARERLAPLPRFYAKATGGNYAHFDAELITNSTYYPHKTYAAVFRHRSGHYGIDGSSFSHQDLAADDERFLQSKKWIWHNRLRAARRSDGLYWGDSTAPFADSLLRHRQWRIRWQSRITKVRYRILPFSLAPAFQLFTVGPLREWSAQFEGMVYDTFAQRHRVSLRTQTEIYWIRRDTHFFQRMRYQITPAYSLDHAMGRLRVGFSAASSHEKVFYFFPDVHVEYYLRPQVLTLLGGLDGAIERHDYWSVFDANPYLLPTEPLRFPVRTFHLYGGARWTPHPHLYSTLRVASKHVRNAPFYYGDSASAPAMRIQYRAFRFITFDADAVFTQPQWWGLTTGWRFRYIHAAIENDTVEAWHLPPFTMQWWGRFSPHAKVAVAPAFEWVSRRPVRTLAGASDRLKGYVLLNLALQYRHSEMISAHLAFHNLTNQSYERWYGYPATGFRVSGGVSVRF